MMFYLGPYSYNICKKIFLRKGLFGQKNSGSARSFCYNKSSNLNRIFCCNRCSGF